MQRIRPGRQVGEYRLERELDRGSLGTCTGYLEHPFKYLTVSISLIFPFSPFPGEIPLTVWEMEPNSCLFWNGYTK